VKRDQRSQLALSGALGVVAASALMGGGLFLWHRIDLKPLVSGRLLWLLLGFLLFFSVAEIPVMIFGMRHMGSSDSEKRLVALVNLVFTFFAAVYAFPFLLLTGRVGIGLALAALSLVRFAGALWFVPRDSSPESNLPPTVSANPNSSVSGEEL
jgi:hypothetical protein